MIGSQLGKVTGSASTATRSQPSCGSFVDHAGDVHWPTLLVALRCSSLLLVGAPAAAAMADARCSRACRRPAPSPSLALDRHGSRPHRRDPSGPAGSRASPTSRSPTFVTCCCRRSGWRSSPSPTTCLTAGRSPARHGHEIRRQPRTARAGRSNAGAGLLQRLSGELERQPHRARRRARQPQPLYSVVTMVRVLLDDPGRSIGARQLPDGSARRTGGLRRAAADRCAGVRRLARFRRSELLLALATTVGVLALGVLYGVLVAIALSILDLLRRVARPHDGILGFVPGVAGMHDIDDYPDARLIRGWSSTATTRRCSSPTPRTSAAGAGGARRRRSRVEWFVLNAEANVEVDLDRARRPRRTAYGTRPARRRVRCCAGQAGSARSTDRGRVHRPDRARARVHDPPDRRPGLRRRVRTAQRPPPERPLTNDRSCRGEVTVSGRGSW